LETLDPSLVCGETGGTGTSISVDGLETGVAYRVVLVAVDPSRNPLAIDVGEVVPGQALDFWEDYKGAGGTAEGGCNTGGAESIGWLSLAFGVVCAAVVFARGRRRRRRGPGATIGPAALLLLLAAGGSARAEPWWESVDQPVE